MLRIARLVLAVVLGLVFVVVGYLRYSDGPLGLLSGGELRAGELVIGPDPDWSFAAGVQEVELQLLEPPRSRTTWILYHDGRIYIPCGFVNIRLWKQWPHEAVVDGRSLVRIEGKRYARELVRVADPSVRAALTKRIAQKYALDESQLPESENLWFFRLDRRPAG
jgi:hypothetical protein